MNHFTLQLGNLLKDRKDQICIVEQLSIDEDDNKIYAIDNATTYHPFSGIEVTPQLLLDLDFVIIKNEYCYKNIRIYFTAGKLFQKMINIYFDWLVAGDCVISRETLYLHDLQNIYSAIGGGKINVNKLTLS